MKIIIKPIPEKSMPGILDDRVKSNLIKSKGMTYPVDNQHIRNEELETLRSEVGCANRDVVPGEIKTEDIKVPAEDGYQIPVRLYEGGGTVKTPVVIYIHGGGFLAGSNGMSDNLCRGIAKGSGSLVISPEYRLAPEHPFPRGLNDCYCILTWLFGQGSQIFNLDLERISICGDSSGGNLATACILKDLQNSKQRISKQILLYPALNPGKLPIEGMGWSIEKYERKDSPELQDKCIYDIGIFMDLISETYVASHEEFRNELVSPVFSKHLNLMPETLIITAEYDYLRLENEWYAKKIDDAAKNVKMICYRGLIHAFAEHLGEYPQAEDCLMEIIDFLI